MISFNELGNYGRLGNQMFQYASLRGIANTLGYDWAIPPSGTDRIDNYGLFDCFEMTSATPEHQQITGFRTRECTSFHYDPHFVDTLPENIDILGYFQTEKYFIDIKDEIVKDFTFKPEILNKSKEFMDAIEADNDIVFIHVRRGDTKLVDKRGKLWSYEMLPDHHPVCTEEYYREAMSNFDGYRFLVMSDSIEWCKQQDMFKGDQFIFSDASHVTYEDGASIPNIDLCLMTLSRHGIIANSSMSWWGAWLMQNPTAEVYAPKTWFGSAYSHYNMSDIRPERWHQV